MEIPAPPFLLPSIPSLYENEEIIENSAFELFFQRNTKLALKFVEGNKLVLIDLKINSKDQPKQILTNLFSEEHLPPYLYLNSLSCLNLICKEDRNESLSSLVYEGHLFSSSLKIWPILLQRVSSINYKEEKGLDDEKLFIEAYNFLLFNSKETRETLSSMEHSLHDLMNRKNEERDREIEELHHLQSQEMDHQLRSQELNKPSILTPQNPSSININTLVAKHLNEMNLLEQKFEKELGETMNQQKQQFKDFVKQFYEIEINNPSKQTPLSPRVERNKKNSIPNLKVPSFKDKATQKNKEKKKPLPFPKLRLNAFRTHSVLSLPQNKLDLENSPLLTSNTNNLNINNKKCIETLTIYVGTQLKTLYNIQLFLSSPLDFMQEKDLEKRKKSNLPLYSFKEGVGAIILLVDDQINYSISNTNSAFLKQAKSKTELHFDSIDAQLEVIKKQFSYFKPNLGDFYITNHSNLHNTHLAFHLVSHSSKGEKKSKKQKKEEIFIENPTPQVPSIDSLLQGLKNILSIATQYNVSTITIPLLLVDDSLSAKNFTEQEYSKRVSQVIKAVKSFLVSRSVTSEDDNNNLNSFNQNFNSNSLKTIRFILHENTSKENIKKCVSLIHSYLST